jgi:hypothetical protein
LGVIFEENDMRKVLKTIAFLFFSLVIPIFPTISEASTVTFKWSPHTSLDGSDGWITFEVPGLSEPHGIWSNASSEVKVLEFKFRPSGKSSTLVFSPPVAPIIPISLRSDGQYLFSSSYLDIAFRVNLAFQQAPAQGWELIDTGDVKIAQGRWNWNLATITPVPEPSSYAMLVAGLVIIGLRFTANRNYER